MESLLSSFFDLIIEIKIGLSADINTNGTDNNIKLPIKLPTNRLRPIRWGNKIGYIAEEIKIKKELKKGISIKISS